MKYSLRITRSLNFFKSLTNKTLVLGKVVILFFLSMVAIKVLYAEENKENVYTMTSWAMTEDKKATIGLEELFILQKEILNRVKKRFGYHFEILSVPSKREAYLFENNRLDAIFGWELPDVGIKYLDRLGFKRIPVYYSASLGKIANILIYTAKGHPKINLVKELRGKLIGVKRGHPIPREMLEDIDMYTLSPVNDNVQNFNKLTLGRIDAAIVIDSDLAEVKKYKEIDLNDFHHGDPVDYLIIAAYFQRTQEGAKLADTFTIVISDMYFDGSYCRIMRKSPFCCAIPCP